MLNKSFHSAIFVLISLAFMPLKVSAQQSAPSGRQAPATAAAQVETVVTTPTAAPHPPDLTSPQPDQGKIEEACGDLVKNTTKPYAQCKLPKYGWFVNAQTGDVLTIRANDKSGAKPSAPTPEDFCAGTGKDDQVNNRHPLDYQMMYPQMTEKRGLIVCDKNPFLFGLRVTVNETLLQEDDLSTVLGKIPSSTNTAAAANQGKKQITPPSNAHGNSQPAPTVAAPEQSSPQRAGVVRKMSSEHAQAASEQTQSLQDTMQQGQHDPAKPGTVEFDKKTWAAALASLGTVYSTVEAAATDSDSRDIASAKDKANKLRGTMRAIKPPHGGQPVAVPQETVDKVIQQSKDLNETLGEFTYATQDSDRLNHPQPSTPRQDFNAIIDDISGLDSKYQNFFKEYVTDKSYLQSSTSDCDHLVEVARTLALRACGLVTESAVAITQEALNTTASLIATENADDRKKDSKLVTYYGCLLDGQRKTLNDVWINVLDPISRVLGSKDAFVFVHYFGPYLYPTEADWKISRVALNKKAENAGSAGYSIPTIQGFDPKDCIAALEADEITAGHTQAASASAPAGNTAHTPSQAPSASPQAAAKTDDDLPIIKPGAFLFGAPRFIVTTGIPMSFVAKHEYQQAIGQAYSASGAPISGSNAVNTIQYKTNDSYQFGYGIAFANVQIHKWPWFDNALWGTFGATAKPDNQGVSGDYFFGISQGFWSNRALISFGDSFVEQQSLIPGLYLGEAVPSTITAKQAIPVVKSYKQGFSVAFSFRVLSTPKTAKEGAKPKKGSATQTPAKPETDRPATTGASSDDNTGK